MAQQSDLYDRLGVTYAETRQSDPRIAARIRAALGDVRTVVNVGAGTGSYEPSDLDVTAVEPSAVMIAQRGLDAAPVRQASAESLPFADGTFDAAMAVLTVHHWTDLSRGLAEMQRVARKVVIFCFSPRVTNSVWITTDYFPSMARLRRPDVEPEMLAKRLGGTTRIEVVPLDHDCTDGSGEAYWGRPEISLDARVRAGMSCFTLLADRDVQVGIDRLAADLRSGAWDTRFGHLRAMPELDCGHRLVIAQASYTS